MALAADARRDARTGCAREVAAAARPADTSIGARRDAHARCRRAPARAGRRPGFATGAFAASRPPLRPSCAPSASDAPDRGPGFGFGSRALCRVPPGRPRARARGRDAGDPRASRPAATTPAPPWSRATGACWARRIASQGEIHALGGSAPTSRARRTKAPSTSSWRAPSSSSATFGQKTSPRWPSPWAPGCPAPARGRRQGAGPVSRARAARVPVLLQLFARRARSATAWQAFDATPHVRRRFADADDADDALVRAPFAFLALLRVGPHNQLILARAVGEYRVLRGALDDVRRAARTTRQPGVLGLDNSGRRAPGAGGARAARGLEGVPVPRAPAPAQGLRLLLRRAQDRREARHRARPGEAPGRGRLARARGLSDGNDASAGDEDPSFSAEETARRDAVRADIAASFQAAAVKHLEERTRRAIAWARESSANDKKANSTWRKPVVRRRRRRRRRERDCSRATLGAVASEAGLPLVLPPPRWCTDNGVMVAWAGVERFALGLAEEAPSAEQVSTPTEEEPGRKTRRGAAVAAVAAGHQRRARDGGGPLEDSANRAAAAGGARAEAKTTGLVESTRRLLPFAFVRVRARVFFAQPSRTSRFPQSFDSAFAMNTRFRRFRRFRLGPGRAFLLRRNRAHNGRIAEILESQTRTGQICPVECEKQVKSRSFSLCFPRARSASRVLRTARARTVRTLLTERVRHRTRAERPLRRAVERYARTRAPHTSRPCSANPRTTDPPSHLQSRHAGRQQGGRGGAQARRGGSPRSWRTRPRSYRAL